MSLEEKPALGFVAEASLLRGGRGNLPANQESSLWTRASVSDVKAGRVGGANGQHVVVAMRVYPRFLPRVLVDEYVPSLSPEPGLFAEYRALKQASGKQNEAFDEVDYEHRFAIGDEGLAHLARLPALPAKAVVLVCQCAPTERCHVDLVLLLAAHHTGATLGPLPFDYARFRRRLTA